jgi:hypothetical protein
MINLKKPLFWAFAVLFIYWFILAVFMIVSGPFSIMGKVLCGLLGISCLGVSVLMAHFPLPSVSAGKYFPLYVGAVNLIVGSWNTYRVIDLQLSSGGYRGPWFVFIVFSGPAMLPVGFLMILFWALDWFVNRKKTVEETRPNTPSH